MDNNIFIKYETQKGVIGAWSRSNQITFFGVQNWGAI